MEALALTVSGSALALSAFALWLGTREARTAERRGRMPILVFQYDGARGWLLRNVGNGPALNVVVASKHVEGEHRGKWVDAVRVPPLSRDGELLLDWLGHYGGHGLGATYDDFLGSEGASYTTTCGNDLSQISFGALFSFPEEQVTASWKVSSKRRAPKPGIFE